MQMKSDPQREQYEAVMMRFLWRPCKGTRKERVRLYRRKCEVILPEVPPEYRDKALRQIVAWAEI